MKTIKINFAAIFAICLMVFAAGTLSAQDSKGTTVTKDRPANNGASGNTGSGTTSGTNTNAGSSSNNGTTAGGSSTATNTYTTEADFVRMNILSGKVGSVIRYEISGEGVKTETGELRLSAEKGSRTRVFCYEKSRKLSIKYASTDNTVKAEFKDLKTCEKK